MSQSANGVISIWLLWPAVGGVGFMHTEPLELSTVTRIINKR